MTVLSTPPDEKEVVPPASGAAAPARSKKMVAMLLMGGALAGKILGFVREVLMAQIVGVALLADGFRTATTAVLLPLAFLQNESVPAVLVPMMKEGHRVGDAPQRLARISIALTFIGFLLMLAMFAFGDYMVNAMVSGFSADGKALTLHLVHIMVLAMPASVLLNCLAAGELTIGKTRVTNLRASVLNVGVIIGLGVLVLTGYNYILGWSFTFAFNALGVWAVWKLHREGHFSFKGVTLRSVVNAGIDFLRRLKPFLALPGAEQANIWVERLLASRIGAGAVASLDYARTLTESAFMLISQPIGLAFLADHGEHNEREQAESIARPLLAAAVPFAAFVYLFSEDIVRLVFQRGAFGEHGVVLTSSALSGIAIGMWASTLGWVLIRLLNRSGRNKPVALTIMCAYAANIALNQLTQHLGAGEGSGVFMIGLGETTRSLVLLFGVTLAIGCLAPMLRLIAIAAIPTALFVAAALELEHLAPASFERLVCGGALWALCTLLSAWLLCPALVRAVFDRLSQMAARRG